MNKQQRQWILDQAWKIFEDKQNKIRNEWGKTQADSLRDAIKNKTITIKYEELNDKIYDIQSYNRVPATWPGKQEPPPYISHGYRFKVPAYMELEKNLLFADAKDVDKILNWFKESLNDSAGN